MAVRIRGNGTIVCAALNKAEPNDVYIDDRLHEILSIEQRILVTTQNEHHMKTGGQWWWKNQVPENILIDKFYT